MEATQLHITFFLQYYLHKKDKHSILFFQEEHLSLLIEVTGNVCHVLALPW